MTDLDARVAALTEIIDRYVSNPSTATCAAVLEAIRAELQKPALHEPPTGKELQAFLDASGFSTFKASKVEKGLESFLQGRAKPTADVWRSLKDGVAKPACKGDPGECAFNGACMYACGSEPPVTEEAVGLDEAPKHLNLRGKTNWVAGYKAGIRASKGEKM